MSWVDVLSGLCPEDVFSCGSTSFAIEPISPQLPVSCCLLGTGLGECVPLVASGTVLLMGDPGAGRLRGRAVVVGRAVGRLGRPGSLPMGRSLPGPPI